MSITIKTEKQSAHPCGFCSTGARHDLCPGGVLNGNLTEVYLCGCTEHELRVRCLDCNNRNADEVSRETWTCIDAEACTAKREKRRREADEALYGGRAPEARREAKERAPKAPAKPKTGSCLCCGETTGGGLFRPGHDAKYLSRFVDRIKEDPNPAGALSAALAAWEAQGISEALRAKLQKRVVV